MRGQRDILEAITTEKPFMEEKDNKGLVFAEPAPDLKGHTKGRRLGGDIFFRTRRERYRRMPAIGSRSPISYLSSNRG